LGDDTGLDILVNQHRVRRVHSQPCRSGPREGTGIYDKDALLVSI
jgi:hypothetical protein